MDPQWIIAIANIIAAISVIFLAIQASFMGKQATLMRDQAAAMKDQLIEMKNQAIAVQRQTADDHERSRRESAVELISEWSASGSLGQPSARYIVERFSLEECRKMMSGTPFYIDDDQYRRLCNAFVDRPAELASLAQRDGKILLSENILFHLGAMCSSFVNGLEIVLIAWRNGTADREIIEQQLSYLVKPEMGFYALQQFREAMGGAAAYPNLGEFITHIKNKKGARDSPMPRDPLGQQK